MRVDVDHLNHFRRNWAKLRKSYFEIASSSGSFPWRGEWRRQGQRRDWRTLGFSECHKFRYGSAFWSWKNKQKIFSCVVSVKSRSQLKLIHCECWGWNLFQYQIVFGKVIHTCNCNFWRQNMNSHSKLPPVFFALPFHFFPFCVVVGLICEIDALRVSGFDVRCPTPVSFLQIECWNARLALPT